MNAEPEPRRSQWLNSTVYENGPIPVRLFREGKSLTEISESLLMDPSQAYRILKKDLGTEFTKAALTEAQQARIVDLARQGWTESDIAKEVGTLTVTVGAELRRSGLKSIRKRRKVNEETVVALRQNGLSIVQVAKKMRISPGRASLIMRRAGLVKPRKVWSRKDLEELLQFRELGFKLHELADHYKVCSAVISRNLRAAEALVVSEGNVLV